MIDNKILDELERLNKDRTQGDWCVDKAQWRNYCVPKYDWMSFYCVRPDGEHVSIPKNGNRQNDCEFLMLLANNADKLIKIARSQQACEILKKPA